MGSSASLLHRTYFAQFFLSLHLFSVLYLASSFIAAQVGVRWVTPLVAGGALVSFIGIVWLAPLFVRSARSLAHFLAWWVVAEALLYSVFLFIEGQPSSPITSLLLGGAFLLSQATYLLGVYAIDLALERLVGDHEGVTGRVRTTALTLMNAALVIAAALSPLLAGRFSYGAAYLFGIAVLLPLALIAPSLRIPLAPAVTAAPSLLTSLRTLMARKPLRDAYLLQIGLRTFYAWMVIYTPLYLHATLGFPWEQLSWVFVVMLLPFVLFERLVGWLADTRWGEREFLFAGFGIIALSVAFFPLLRDASLLLWAVVLFLTRTGAAIVEAASESYFFKHTNADGDGIIALFRSTRPVALFLASAASGMVTLLSGSIAQSFWALAALMAGFGAYALFLKDTEPTPSS